MINSVLQHRATIERATEVLTDGTPVRTWAVTMVRCPVLLSRDEAVSDPTWTASQAREAGSRCTLFASASIDIRPGDRVHVTRPPLSGSFEVLPDPSTVMRLHSISHREYAVRSVG